MEPIVIDGSFGEGGGQILRTSLGLSLVTGRPFRIEKIRAGRKKPGLLRQHLTAVLAAKAIGDATVNGAELGSTALAFRPRGIRPGDYTFSVGTAGSTTLVLQTILPALLMADAPSRVTFEGGTHNMQAPPFDFLELAFLPLLRRMGAKIEATLTRHGFFPAGGGSFVAEVTPAPLHPLALADRGEIVSRKAIALVANLPTHIAHRELKTAAEMLGLGRDGLHQLTVDSPGPGNVISIRIESEHATEVFTAFGQAGVSAENVAREAAKEALAYLASTAAVGPHLADQLLIPLALAGGGCFTASEITEHTRTNIAVIERFLPVRFSVTEGPPAEIQVRR